MEASKPSDAILLGICSNWFPYLAAFVGETNPSTLHQLLIPCNWNDFSFSFSFLSLSCSFGSVRVCYVWTLSHIPSFLPSELEGRLSLTKWKKEYKIKAWNLEAIVQHAIMRATGMYKKLLWQGNEFAAWKVKGSTGFLSLHCCSSPQQSPLLHHHFPAIGRQGGWLVKEKFSCRSHGLSLKACESIWVGFIDCHGENACLRIMLER